MLVFTCVFAIPDGRRLFGASVAYSGHVVAYSELGFNQYLRVFSLLGPAVAYSGQPSLIRGHPSLIRGEFRLFGAKPTPNKLRILKTANPK